MKRQAQLLADAGQFDSLHQLYHRTLQENGANPAAWKKLARDYFDLSSVNVSEREKSARQIEITYERNVETPVLRM